MNNFPLLRDVFGVDVAAIDEAAVLRAIRDRASENDQLDWKRAPYGKEGLREIAKDVAAFANHHGGLIVIGVSEGGADDGVATVGCPFERAVAERQRIENVVRSRIRPHLRGVSVRLVAAHQDSNNTVVHYVTVEVPPSRDAPHAVIPGSPNGTTFEYPVRRETDTKWLTEAEVAIAYRDRFLARVDTTAAVQRILGQGAAGIDLTDDDPPAESAFPEQVPRTWQAPVWLTLAVTPTQPGERPAGGAARTREVGFMTTWLSRARTIPGHDLGAVDPTMARAAVRRTTFGHQPPGRLPPSQPSAAVALHHDGAGFVALRFRRQVWVRSRGTGTHPNRAIGSDALEWATFVGLSLLTEHAIDTLAGGELEVAAQLAIRNKHPLDIAVPDLGRASVGDLDYVVADDATPRRFTPEVRPVIATATQPLDDYSHRSAARTASQLATDMLAEFGVDNPRVFSVDGHVTPEHFATPLQAAGAWATEHINAHS